MSDQTAVGEAGLELALEEMDEEFLLLRSSLALQDGRLPLSECCKQKLDLLPNYTPESAGMTVDN